MPHLFAKRPEFSNFDVSAFGFGKGENEGHLSALLPELKKQAVAATTPAMNNGVWEEISKTYGGHLDILRSGTDAEIRKLVRALFGTPLTHGFALGHVVFEALKTSEGSRAHVGIITMDRLYRLAEAVGVERTKSLEHGGFHIEIGDVDDLINRIEAKVGFDLGPPPTNGNLFGLKTSRGIYCDRHFDGIYGAWRARELIGDARTATVCEIGGGAGHLAYYARKAGIKTYTLIDLPVVGLVQYILLSSAFGPDVVVNGLAAEGQLQLASAFETEKVDFSRFDLVINVDSMPEMPAPVAASYVQQIKQAKQFLSINQESVVPNGEAAQNDVSDLCAAAGLTRNSRYPSWLRSGYVEEVFGAKNCTAELNAIKNSTSWKLTAPLRRLKAALAH